MTQTPLFADATPTFSRHKGAASTLAIRVHGPFWQLWATSITGVNLNQHCALSLRGPRLRGYLGPGAARGRWIVADMPSPRNGVIGWYVCGVSVGSKLAQNAHLFAVPAPGEVADLTWSWGRARLTNARAVPITPDFIDPTDPHTNDPYFANCRNWQAAWMIHEGLTQ